MERISTTAFLALSGLLAVVLCSCNEEPAPAGEDAQRIARAQRWGERQEALRKTEAVDDAAVSAVALPDDLPSPELFATTRRIYASFDQSGARQAFTGYRELVPAAGFAGLDMVAVPAGEFMMGSPGTEAHRKPDEGPRHRVAVDAFWISSIEIPWELYMAFMENGMPRNKAGELVETRPDGELWDAVVQPTAPYTSMNLGMGHGYEHGFPAIAMSHYAASKFCEWLSAQTGRYYRLPTEAEWEYACRAGSETSFAYGDSEAELDQYAWYWNNSHDQYQRTATRKPNAWKLFDMHGNVAEWVLDCYDPDAYAKREGQRVSNPLVLRPGTGGHVVRGGSWEDDPDALRSAARRKSSPDWNMQDPQNPKSIWYLTDGGMIGFRIVRPVKLPDVITVHRLWNASKGQY